ncbi:CapA family protein [Paracoccus aminovorans]|uniref:CapA family protein n=1 Tax=Paracoccus aminovorans TaxID=34004 RepID=UPI0007849511|nr:CapA family protein [Paracoccus aminovorans]
MAPTLPWVSQRDLARETGPKLTAPFRVAAVGDLISPQPLRREDPRFAFFGERIRAADVGLANMESSLVDMAGNDMAIAGTAAPFSLGEAIRDMGFTMMSRANNHTFDCGAAGMVSTDAALDRLGITHAGTGPNLQEARKARFRETPKGRVGLVSVYSLADTGHFGPTYARTEATSRIGGLGGAPGINPLHLTAYNIVAPDDLKRLHDIATAAYGPRPGAWRPATDAAPARLRFFDQWYQAGDDPGSIHYEMAPADRDGLLDSIRNGKIYADFLIVAIHSHQATRFDPAGAFGDVRGLKEPVEHYAPNFLIEFAHAAIDAGADMFVSHGVHALAGVEVYRGRPIFYGLSNFIFQCGLQLGPSYDVLANWQKKSELEHPACHEAVLAEADFEDGELREVRLYPADLGGGARPLSQMGIPLVPEPAVRRRILEDMARYSEPYGTRIEIRDGLGIIRP